MENRVSLMKAIALIQSHHLSSALSPTVETDSPARTPLPYHFSLWSSAGKAIEYLMGYQFVQVYT